MSTTRKRNSFSLDKKVSILYVHRAKKSSQRFRCPCGCFHCSARRSVQKERPELSTSEIKNVIDQCLDMGISVITFTGREPLVRKDIFELIEYVDKKKAVTVLFTNGLLLDRETFGNIRSVTPPMLIGA